MDVEARVRATGLLAGPVLVLLSGGRDSVCLLDLAVRIAGAASVRALHVNYGLRDSADEDEALCREECARLGVELDVSRPRRPEGNLQAWARDRRYAEAARIARGLIATGHTASDQAETVLYRLAASPGRRALLGMPERDGRLVRPLLSVTRAETTAYCEAHGLPYRDDPTNASPVYARNRVRHGLLEALRDLHPAAEANVLRTLAILRDEAEVLDRALDTALAQAGDPPETRRLAELPPALARLAVQRLAGDAPAIGHRAGEILALGAHGGTATLDLGGGLRAVVEYGRLRFDRAGTDASERTGARDRPGPDRLAAEPPPAPLPIPGRAPFAGGEIASERGPDLPIADGTLDAAALAATLEVRPWRPGDRMRPLGLGGSRSLQDLFVDRKVPRERRRAIPIVLSDGEIAWVPGVATGERFRVTPATRERVRLSWTGPHRVETGSPPRLPASMEPEEGIGEILVPADELQRRVEQLGAEISADYDGRDLLLIGVLKGAVFFLSDLMRHISIPCEVDFMAVASYGSATDSSGVVRILKDLDAVIAGRDVLIVEDIVDSGLTLSYLLRTLNARGPATLEVCALLTKPERRKVDLPTRYVGFEIPDRFAIGYGLDHAERYRNLPYVAALANT